MVDEHFSNSEDSGDMVPGQTSRSELRPSSGPHPRPLSRPTFGRCPERGDRQPASYEKLAKRITGITSNCLFTAIVLVAGLGIGRQILQWWSADAPSSPVKPTISSGGLDDPSQMQVMQFGRQGWCMARREFHGSREAVEAQLCRDCREMIEGAAIPHEKPTEEQKSLLAALAKSPPIEAELPRWQLFAPEKKNRSILVGVKPPLGKDRSEAKGKNASQVVLWGIVLPKGADEWSVLVFTPSVDRGDAIPLLPNIPLPAKCRKMLSVQAVNGGAMVGFSGPGEPANWRKHFENSFTKGGWRLVVPWQQTATIWYARYRGRSQQKNCTVDLHFSVGEKGEMSGMVIVERAE